MPQTKSVLNTFHSRIRTAGEKLETVLRTPLPPIPFPVPRKVKPPAKKKPEAPAAARVIEPIKPVKRRQNRLVSVEPVRKTLPAQIPYSAQRAVRGMFTLTQNKEEFEKILFVLRACNKYSGTAFTNVLHVEKTETGSRLVATDGKRMHVADIKTRIKPGDYKPLITSDSIKLGLSLRDVQFPNWERVVPKATARCGIINLENTAIGKAQSTTREKNRVYHSFVNLAGEKVNPNYLEDLTKKQWAIYRQSGKYKPLLLKEDGAKMETYAVVMPLAA